MSSVPSSSHSKAGERKCKSVVLLREITALRDLGKKLKVDFDSDGLPINKIGSNGLPINKNASKYTSYIGLLGRSKVPLNIPTWKDVTEELKLKIWDDVKSVFDIPETEEKQKQVIGIANTTWTNFKSKLTSLYVFRKPTKGRKLPKETDPTKKYPYLTPEVWKEFKAKRLSEEFLAISKAASEVQSHNIYPHRMSRGGYRMVKMKLEERLKMKEAENGTGNDDEGKDSEAPTVIKRGDLWIEGRLGKDGKPLNDEIKKKIDDIHVVNEMVKKGEFLPNGKDDELTKALGTKEHYGRVRGVGGGVGHKQYFGRCKRKRGEGELSPEFMKKLTEQITAQVQASVYKEMEHIKSNGNASSQTVENKEMEADEVEMNRKTGNDSQHDDTPDPFDEIPEKGFECELAVEDVEKKKVALGRVFKKSVEASVCHGKAIGEDVLRVAIYVVMKNQDETPLPLPTDEFATLGDAIGSFLLWPKKLITLSYSKKNKSETAEKEKSEAKKSSTFIKHKSADDSSHSKDVASGKSETNPPVTRSNKTLQALLDQKYNCRRFLSKVVSMMSDTQVTDLNLSEDVLGTNKRLRLVKDDLSQLLDMGKICLPVIETFLGYLSSVCDNDTYGFISPELISLVDDNEAVTKICKRMKDLKAKKIWFAPYFEQGHWMLLVLDVVERNQIYWFDSLGNSAPSKLRSLINTSIRIYGFNGGPRMSPQTPTWLKTLCARQKGQTECGYYVMRYMLEIVTRSNQKPPIEEIFKHRLPYSQEEVDEVRDLWADYFLNA